MNGRYLVPSNPIEQLVFTAMGVPTGPGFLARIKSAVITHAPAVTTVALTAAATSLTLAAAGWRLAWYLPAWLAGCAWAALRDGWRDATATPTAGIPLPAGQATGPS